MKDFIDYLNHNSGAMTFLITFVYVIATIFICLANIKSANATREQLLEQKRQFEETNRPIIEVEFICKNGVYYGLSFVNNGKYTAQNVKIQFDKSFIDSIPEETFAKLLHAQEGKTCVIGVNQHHDLFIVSNDYYDKKFNAIVATGNLEYEARGKIYKDKFCIDVSNYLDIISVVKEDRKTKDLLKAIKEQNIELRGIKQTIQKLEIYKKEEDINV